MSGIEVDELMDSENVKHSLTDPFLVRITKYFTIGRIMRSKTINDDPPSLKPSE